MKVYHGTMKKIEGKFLKPHRAFERVDYEPWVHFATSYEVALLFASNPIRAFFKEVNPLEIPAFSTHLYLDGAVPQIYELYRNMFESLYHIPVYVYECDVDEKDLSDPFSRDKYERVTTKEVEYSRIYEISDLLRELKNCKEKKKIELIYYDEGLKVHDIYYDYLGCKVEEARTQWEADFYYRNFPDKWKIIQSIPAEFKRKSN